MPTNLSLTGPRARYAALSHWRPGSPEHQEAGREFYFLLLTQQVEEILAKSLPFTDEQRQRITDLLTAR